MLRRSVSKWVTGALALLLLAGGSIAAYGQDQNRARDEVRAGRILAFSQIKRNVERRFEARVLDVQLVPRGSGSVYDIKMLNKDGDVIMVQTDAATGQVIRVSGGR